ncbi:hypothetical protein BD309DRAFT_854562 [Dichomitus squalens]|uniref:Pre-mRNA-splicing factor CWC24 n=1 Tax=Dichomitus squalens TaxID=114155 RepID=A0A4Q9Q9W7_9APHY|nr:hypothetical protein BD311DRAFT_752093 [Dichomitus squalens]TBU48144.1 hypothetical protein BD309DRAFT_854562 [Dichomitus squalens]TBU64433.1 hypothetical protein BD310DRAFT_397510 [Dichomitus squalens]
MADTENVSVPFFKKKGRGRPTTSRKRSTSPPATALTAPVPSSSKSEVVLPSRKSAASILSAGTKRTASQRQEDEDEDTREGPDVKWTAAGSHVNAALEILEGDEAEALLSKRLKSERKDEDEEEVPDDGLYRGQKAYASHIRKNKEVPKAMRVGPQRSNNSTIRTVTIVDYQPDVCKDYKETGYCGYGDTCKFLHDRGTYLQGWQLDKLAADPKKQANEDVSDSDSDEDIPFACILCRKPYTDPVVTRCGHYFCSACAIKRFAKTPKCAACGAPTGGIFNRADKVISKLKKKQETAGAEGADEDGEGGTGGVQIEGLQQASDSGDEDED